MEEFDFSWFNDIGECLLAFFNRARGAEDMGACGLEGTSCFDAES